MLRVVDMGKHKKARTQETSDSEDETSKITSSDREDRRQKGIKLRRRRSRSPSPSSDSSHSESLSKQSRSKLRKYESSDSEVKRRSDAEESDVSEGEIRPSAMKQSKDSDSRRKRRAEESGEESEHLKRKKSSGEDNKSDHRSKDEGRGQKRRGNRSRRSDSDEDVSRTGSRYYEEDRWRESDDRKRRSEADYVPRSYYEGEYLDESRERRRDDRGHRRYDERRRGRRSNYEESRDRRDRDRGRRRDDDRSDRGNRHERDSSLKEKESRDSRGEAISASKNEGTKATLDTSKAPTLGAYIPPARLRMMQNAIEDKSSASYQRLAWEALKKSINGLINKVNTSNISVIVRELFKENLIRGRGILCRSVMQAQQASPTYTNVFAALIAIINTKFPNIGELLLKRLIVQFRRGYKRNDKPICLSAVKFIAHLVNQQVAHEVLALELLTLLLEQPTSHSIEVAIAFLKEVGARLDEVSPRGAHAIFERLRHLLHEGKVEKRIQYMIEVMAQVKKDKYEKHPAVIEELDLVEEEDQFTHLVTLDEEIDGQEGLNVFKMDEEYVANEEKYAALRKEILDESEGDEEGSDDDEEASDDEEEEQKEEGVTIVDKTETNLLALRRTIYLTIQSSLDYEECCHKLLKMNFPEGQESELCHMILDCCAQQRTYEKFFGLLAQRFCQINMKYVTPFEEIFKATYDTVHRLDTNKLRNVAKFFAHLLFTDAISWTVIEHIRLTEEDTTSSSRIFVKILCQELSEYMGLGALNKRFNDKTLKPYFEGLFPKDNPKNSRFSINFFTSIGLGGLTDELREFLRPKARPEA